MLHAEHAGQKFSVRLRRFGHAGAEKIEQLAAARARFRGAAEHRHRAVFHRGAHRLWKIHSPAREIALEQRLVLREHHRVFEAVRRPHRRGLRRPFMLGTVHDEQRAVRKQIGKRRAGRLEIAAHAVELVDKRHARQLQALHGAEQNLGLRLHAFDGGDDEHRAVEHRKRPLHLADEIGVTGRVDQIDDGRLRLEHGVRRFDRDAARPLDRQRIGLRGAEVDRPGRSERTAVKQKLFRQARLARVHVRENADVDFSFHALAPLLRAARCLKKPRLPPAAGAFRRAY